jgi:ParB-like chromosome segregation protein Spo0J
MNFPHIKQIHYEPTEATRQTVQLHMPEFPAYKTVSVSSLIPYARNSRTHSDAQVGQIAASIKEFGFLNPIIVDGDNGIIAGHGRVLAAQKLGLAELPVIEAGHLSDTQRRAYIIADNKLAMNAGLDDEMLRVELDALGADGFDLELTGFSLDEVRALSFDDEAETEMPELADGDKEPYQQKTFMLHDEQAAIVDDAITLARTNPLSDTGVNENSNGNALALICAQWLERN